MENIELQKDIILVNFDRNSPDLCQIDSVFLMSEKTKKKNKLRRMFEKNIL